ncbi:MAG: Fur family transcriptional regulator [Chloroflexota bacterium]
MSQLAEVLRERGFRMTPQRQLILDAIESLVGHISADAVHTRITDQFPQINISTVYRTLDLLEELGLVRHTHFDDGVAQYHLAEVALHQHLVCRGCGNEQELDVEVLRPLGQLLDRQYGFQLDLSHFALIGRCANCLSAAS